ncbi:MAG TPA: phage tail tube protein [Dissulfurispiraceae bacterium]|nr:phage tail tube protein [Dissulfurispiraceae bacterium]
MERIGQGTLLAVSADGGTVWTSIARIETIGEFGIGEVDDVEVTTHDTAGGFKTFIAGLADGGEVEFSGVWIADATQRSLSGLRGLLRDWRVTLPGGLGIWRSQGYVKTLTINPQREDRIEFSVTIKLSGAPTLTW